MLHAAIVSMHDMGMLVWAYMCAHLHATFIETLCTSAHALTCVPCVQRGQLFNGDFLRKCLRDVFGLGLFESMSVNSRPSAKDDTKVDIDLMVKERPVNTADLDLEWQLARTPSGRLGLTSLMPGTPVDITCLHEHGSRMCVGPSHASYR